MLHKHSTVLCYPGLQMVMQQIGSGFKPEHNTPEVNSIQG